MASGWVEVFVVGLEEPKIDSIGLPVGRRVSAEHDAILIFQKESAGSIRLAAELGDPGIDIDVPTKLTDKRTKPDDVRKSVRAAFEGGADGVVLAREYVEMWLANLQAAGDTLREVFKQSPG